MMKVRNVEPLSGHRLALEFSDGTRGIAKLGALVKKKPFTPLQDEKVFATARLEGISVEWPKVDLGIAPEALYALVHDLPHPTTFEAVRANELTVSLRELRAMAACTQAEVAEALAISQGSISQLEGAPDHRLSALRRYVEALGAELEVVAVLGDKRLVLRGV